MLVSAAMAERPRAAAPGRSRPAPAPAPPATDAPRHSTARVATTQGVRTNELPGWFWGALGCMTVLVVGLSVVFFFQSGSAPAAASASAGPAAAAPTPAAATTATAAGPPGAAAPGIRIEPMAPP